MAFYRGQKVVCVDGFGPSDGDIDPVEGEVYTIRDIIDSIGRNGPTTGLAFFEIRNKPRALRTLTGVKTGERYFAATAFRPLVDISDFEAIVAEVKRGKPRRIKDDKFDKQRVHSASATSLSADAAGSAGPIPIADPASMPARDKGRQVTGLFASLTAEQQSALLSYRGPVEFGPSSAPSAASASS